MRYIAFIRGIMPTNPNMKREKLAGVFKTLGFSNVHSVIASGNIIFNSASKNSIALEEKIEKAFSKYLGFERAVIIRTQEEIERLIKKNPFKNIEDKKPNYLVVTFFKSRKPELPTTINLHNDKTVNFMAGLDKKYGKNITTRTWKTINRVIRKFYETEDEK